MTTTMQPLPFEVSRPLAQRTEYGPIIHEVGSTIYDEISEVIADGSFDDMYASADMPHKLKHVNSVGRLARFAQVLGVKTADHTLEVMKRPEYIDLYRFISRNARSATGGHMNLTYHENADLLMAEGMVTGVTVPFHLYRAIEWCRSKPDQPFAPYDDRVSPRSLDAQEVVHTMMRPGFSRMLDFMSYGWNGSLGVSAGADSLVEGATLNTFNELDVSVINDVINILDENDAYFTPRFVEAHLNRMRKVNRDARRSGNRATETGGCPVRHETFSSLGDFATKFFAELGTDGPRNQGESLVQRGNRFVYTAIAQVSGVKVPEFVAPSE